MTSNLSSELSILKFKAVYWVDDENVLDSAVKIEKLRDEVVQTLSISSSQAVRDVISKVSAGWKESLVEIATFHDQNNKKLEHNKTEPDKVIKAKVDKLEAISEDFREDLIAMLIAFKGKLSKAQKKALENIFEPACSAIGSSWHSYSFSDWEAKQTDILAFHHSKNPALILLDQQNTRDSSSLDGTQILKNVCSSEHADGFRFFFITNTCDVDGEFKHAKETLKRLEIAADGINPPLFSVSKARIKAKADSAAGVDTLDQTFVSLLRRLRIADLSAEMSTVLGRTFEKANTRAFDMLRGITLHEFLYAVTQSSQIEGVSELDTLLRLIHIQQREALVERLLKNSKLKKLLQDLRSIPVEVRETMIDSDSDLRKLRSREIYWHHSAINSLFQPLANGDVFELLEDGSTRHFLLLANDCDLMLREKGTRKLQSVMLFEVTPKVGGDTLEVALEAPIPGHQSRAAIVLNRYVAVSTLVLDLCWLNEDGQLSWRRRKSATLQKLPLLKSQLARLEELSQTWDSPKTARAVAMSMPFGAVKQRSGSSPIVLPFKRIARLNGPYAQGLLTRVASAMARPSYEHDFSPKSPKTKS